MSSLMYAQLYVWLFVCMYVCIHLCIHENSCEEKGANNEWSLTFNHMYRACYCNRKRYGMATIHSLDKVAGVVCKRALQKQGSFHQTSTWQCIKPRILTNQPPRLIGSKNAKTTLGEWSSVLVGGKNKYTVFENSTIVNLKSLTL